MSHEELSQPIKLPIATNGIADGGRKQVQRLIGIIDVPEVNPQQRMQIIPYLPIDAIFKQAKVVGL